MAIDALVKPFLALPLFRDLTPFQLTEIVRRADRIVYRPGDAIIREDEEGDAAIVIISGDAAVMHDGGRGRVEPVPEGSMIGELAMLVETVYAATVIARGPVRALRITRAEMHALMDEEPTLAEHLSNQIASRLTRLATELRSIDQSLGEVENARVRIRNTRTEDISRAGLH